MNGQAGANVNAAIAAHLAEPPRWHVDSATGVDVLLPLAGPGARAMAFTIDWLLRSMLSALWYVGSTLIYNLAQGHGYSLRSPAAESPGWYFLVLLPVLAIYFLYHPVLELVLAGSTPGKRRAGIRIVTRIGATPRAGALLLRNVFRLVDFFPGTYGVGLLAVANTRLHTRVGDLAAGTLVVYDLAAIAPPDPSRRQGGASSAGASITALLQPLDDYQQLAHDAAASPADERLAARYAQAHATLFRPAWDWREEGRRMFSERIPQAMSWLRPYLGWVTLLFLLASASGWWLVHRYPDLARLFASPEMISAVERGELWTDGMLNIVPSSVMSVQLLTNNIVVSLFAFVAGFLFGLGTLYIVGLNGLMLGAVFALCAQHGMAGRLFEFIVAHGLVEISCICISGAAGAAVGEALMRPTESSRAASFAAACARSGDVIFAVILLLVGCGFIEGFISPNNNMPLATHLIVGAGYFFLMLALLQGWLFRGSGPATQK